MTDLKVFLLVPLLLFCLSVPNTHAQMVNTIFKITSSVLSGGGNFMPSENYQLVSTSGQPTPTGNNSSAGFILDAGFWYTMLVTAVGDVYDIGAVNLEDVIAALQVVTGQSTTTIVTEADTDGDGKIGLRCIL